MWITSQRKEDFSKAFDRVNHSFLVDKLKSLCLDGPFLQWIGDYLHP